MRCKFQAWACVQFSSGRRPTSKRSKFVARARVNEPFQTETAIKSGFELSTERVCNFQTSAIESNEMINKLGGGAARCGGKVELTLTRAGSIQTVRPTALLQPAVGRWVIERRPNGIIPKVLSRTGRRADTSDGPCPWRFSSN